MELFRQASEIIGSAAEKATGDEGKRINEELMRFNYGYKAMDFIFNYVKLTMAFENNEKKKIKQLYEITERLRKELTEIHEPLEEMKYELENFPIMLMKRENIHRVYQYFEKYLPFT